MKAGSEGGRVAPLLAWPGGVVRAAERLVPAWMREDGGGVLSRAFWVFFAVFVAGMLLISLVGDQGLIAYWRLTSEAGELRAKVERMEIRRRELREVIRALHDDPAYIEQLARRELGLVRPGETILQIPPTAPKPGAEKRP